MHRYLKLFSALLFVGGLMLTTDGQAQTAPADLIVGDWQPSDGRSVIRIYKGKSSKGEDPEKYYGQIVWLKEPNDDKGKPRTDINNPDASKRKEPLRGMVNMKELEFVGDKRDLIWDEGNIYDPKSGSDYSFKAEIDRKNPNLLYGKGYIGVSLFGREDTWKRLVKK
ncbi:MAG: DUF2147 domain-containing protein [Catalinimonas sp.]